MRNKKGDLNISFGMIFSIILIVAFLAFAFYAIKTFLGVQKTAQAAIFRDDLQKDIDEIWKSPQGTQKMSYILPSKIEKVCFKNSELENLFFLPKNSVEGLEPKNINHIDLSRITSSENAPLEERNTFCIETISGKIELILKKELNEELVMITRS